VVWHWIAMFNNIDSAWHVQQNCVAGEAKHVAGQAYSLFGTMNRDEHFAFAW